MAENQIDQCIPNMTPANLEALMEQQSPQAQNMTPVSIPNRSCVRVPGDGVMFVPVQYPPFSEDANRLFQEAATLVGLPAGWATEPGLHEILRRESDGWVGRPNYTYGERSRDKALWVEVHAELREGVISVLSSATGLGQLLLRNVRTYYPSGAHGIGNALQEAAGMLAYIKAAYENPANAWAKYGTKHEGY